MRLNQAVHWAALKPDMAPSLHLYGPRRHKAKINFAPIHELEWKTTFYMPYFYTRHKTCSFSNNWDE